MSSTRGWRTAMAASSQPGDGAIPSEPEPQPVDGGVAVPLPSAPPPLAVAASVDRGAWSAAEIRASEEAAQMGFSQQDVDRIQERQRAALGVGYCSVHELLDALDALERSPPADAAAAEGSGRWAWKKGSDWEDYAPEQSQAIEAAYAACGGTGRVVLQNGTHAIDFQRMRQINMSDEARSRAVRRV